MPFRGENSLLACFFFLISKNGHFYLFILVRSNRALINVWIPSVFLRGKAANAFHVYQVSTWVSCQPVVFVPQCFACWHYLYICRICADEVVCGHWSGGRMCMEFPVVALCCCCSVTGKQLAVSRSTIHPLFLSGFSQDLVHVS